MIIAKLALAASLTLTLAAVEDCEPASSGGSTTCAPQVAFWKPARGHVVDVKTCTSSFFGVTDERTYVKIRFDDTEEVWVVDTQGGCNAGDDWDVYEPQGPARCS